MIVFQLDEFVQCQYSIRSFTVITVYSLLPFSLVCFHWFLFFILFKRIFLDDIQQFATKMVSTCNLTKQAYLYTIKKQLKI